MSKSALGDAVHLDDAAAFDLYAGLRIVRAVEGGKAVLGVLDRELVEPERPLVPIGKPLPAIGGHALSLPAGRLVRNGRRGQGSAALVAYGSTAATVKPMTARDRNSSMLANLDPPRGRMSEQVRHDEVRYQP